MAIMKQDLDGVAGVSRGGGTSGAERGLHIHWPDEFHPDRAPIHIQHAMAMNAACDAIWNVLIDARRWPSFYAQASNVVIEGAEVLGPGVRFSWKTMGVQIACVVREFEPSRRIAWEARGLGTRAYHAWLMTPTDRRTYLRTEETQYGWLCRFGAAVMPNRLHLKWHQIWLEEIAKVAA